MNNNNRLNRKRTARIAPNLKEEARKRVFHIELTQAGTKDNLDITSNVSGEDVVRIAAAIAKARVETLAIGNEKKIKEVENIIHILTNILYNYKKIMESIIDKTN